ncbi:MAG: hypothetical protein IPG50_22840 [Myxococcales bacterium]|nr:hypothetical protein [Myxococcales bacterium]
MSPRAADVIREVDAWLSAIPDQLGDPEHVVTYDVRTPRLYWAVVVVLSAVALAFALGTPLMFAKPVRGAGDWLFDLLWCFAVALPLVYVASTGEYRASGAVRLGQGRIEVPDASGTPTAFLLGDTAIDVREVIVRYTLLGLAVQDVARGYRIELRSANGRTRRLSTLTLVERTRTGALLADLGRMRLGFPPLGEDPMAAPKPTSRDAYDDRIDEELSKLD